MPIQNGQYYTYTGKDTTIKVVTAYGSMDLSQVKDFEAKPDYKDRDSTLMSGARLRSSTENGWGGSITVMKSSNQIDTIFSEMADDWHDRGIVQHGTLYQYETQPDGSQDIWQYDDVSLKLESAGSSDGDKEVEQKIAFMSARRRKVG